MADINLANDVSTFPPRHDGSKIVFTHGCNRVRNLPKDTTASIADPRFKTTRDYASFRAVRMTMESDADKAIAADFFDATGSREEDTLILVPEEMWISGHSGLGESGDQYVRIRAEQATEAKLTAPESPANNGVTPVASESTIQFGSALEDMHIVGSLGLGTESTSTMILRINGFRSSSPTTPSEMEARKSLMSALIRYRIDEDGNEIVLYTPGMRDYK